MIEQMRALMQAASGVTEIPRKRAERMAKDLLRQTETRREQVGGLAEEIMRRSRENADMLRTLVSGEIRRQIRTLGLVTRSDLDRLGRRVRALEERPPAAPARPKPKSKPKPKARAKAKVSPTAKEPGP